MAKASDSRDAIIGTYLGALSITNSGDSNDGESLNEQYELENHMIIIKKSSLLPNAIVLIQGKEKIVMTASDKDVQFEDVFIINSLDCNGTESYQLIFDSKNNTLRLKYKNSSVCSQGVFTQESSFEGYK